MRILPPDVDHRFAVDSFAILQFGKEHETTLHDIVNTEHLSSQLHVEGQTDTYEFRLSLTLKRSLCLLLSPGS